MDITPQYYDLCRQVRPGIQLKLYTFNVDTLNEFLKEAYRINTHISELVTYLRRIRPAYLSLSQPARHTRLRQSTDTHLTDVQRAQIDASTSQLLSQINASITQLHTAETARAEGYIQIAAKKRQRGLGVLKSWASGGGVVAKSPEEQEEDGREEALRLYREEVVRYLRRRLERAGEAQRGMVEVRLEREREKEASVLYKIRGAEGSRMGGSGDWSRMGFAGSDGLRVEELQREKEAESELSPEQLQLFEKENSSMLKHYTDQLDQVKNAEKSLIEISDLQTTLAANLTVQADNIDILVEDSFMTHENVGKGNKELKRASERKSTAQMVFWTTCAFCTGLVVWDLIF
ncbi:snare protein [Rhizodiscina lignyota]|uniref:Snare protein n=1 Tax=Rhizodiscina lignyota TaxID=1504668 RepID=A0A9P4M647_9PEZI|nr:snare protein [Rhizodiscina lignyota]